MARFLLVVETNCADPACEAEFNEWYNKTHLPDLLEVPGVKRATRYELVQPVEGKGRFMAAYEIESDNIDQTMKVLGEHMTKKRAAGRYSRLVSIAGRGLYKRLGGLPE